MASRIGIVAYVGDAICRETVMANAKKTVAHRGGNPGIDAVRDDVVEGLRRSIESGNIALLEPNIRKTKFGYRPVSFRDWTSRQINAEKRAPRKRVGHRDEICAVTATEFQHAAVLNGRRLHAEQRRDRCQSVGMRLNVGRARVGDFVVSVWSLVNHGSTVAEAKSVSLPSWRGFLRSSPAVWQSL